MNQQTDAATELNKDGGVFGFGLSASSHWKSFSLNYGIGLDYVHLTGEDTRTSAPFSKEKVSVWAPFFELGSHYNFGRWSVGPEFRLFIGDKVSFASSSVKDSWSVFAGVSSFYRLPTETPLRIQLKALTDLSIESRQNYLIMAGFQVGFNLVEGMSDLARLTREMMARTDKRTESSDENRRQRAALSDQIKAKDKDAKNFRPETPVNFSFGSAELADSSKQFLQCFADVAKKQKRNWSFLIIEGHTDSTGDDEFNLRLSDERARVVMEFLKQNGLDAERLSFVGYGESRTVPGKSQESAENRRTEFLFSGTKRTFDFTACK